MGATYQNRETGETYTIAFGAVEGMTAMEVAETFINDIANINAWQPCDVVVIKVVEP